MAKQTAMCLYTISSRQQRDAADFGIFALSWQSALAPSGGADAQLTERSSDTATAISQQFRRFSPQRYFSSTPSRLLAKQVTFDG